MREDTPGSSREPPERTVPSDASAYAKLRAWKLSISKSEHSLIIETTDYHPGPLHMTREDLQKIMELL